MQQRCTSTNCYRTQHGNLISLSPNVRTKHQLVVREHSVVEKHAEAGARSTKMPSSHSFFRLNKSTTRYLYIFMPCARSIDPVCLCLGKLCC